VLKAIAAFAGKNDADTAGYQT